MAISNDGYVKSVTDSVVNRQGVETFWREYREFDFNSSYFVTARVFEGLPNCWDREYDYVRWRHDYSERIGVDPQSLTLVGSAKLGYSLSPSKGFKTFDSHSDLDLAVVSESCFDQAWKALRKTINEFDIIKDEKKNEIKGYARKLIFDGTVDVNSWISEIPFAAAWGAARDDMSTKMPPSLWGHEINYRLYRDRESLRQYQLKSVFDSGRRAKVWLSADEYLKD